MSTWLFFALLSPILWAVTNPLDAAVRRNYIKNDFAITWLFACQRFILAFLVFAFWAAWQGFEAQYLLMSLAGIFWTFPMLLYFRALENEEPSRVALFLQFVPVFAFLIASVFLGENLSTQQFFAFILILIGGAIAAFKKVDQQWNFSSGFYLICLAGFLWATSDVMFQAFETMFDNFPLAFAYFFAGSGLPWLLTFLLPKTAKRFWGMAKKMEAKGWGFLITANLVGLAGSCTFAYALTLGKVSLTAVLIGAQPLFVMIFSVIMSRLFEEIPKERFARLDILMKLSSFVLIMIGLYLLN
jgi:drug/metabolite transporter (DMT)-like permease